MAAMLCIEETKQELRAKASPVLKADIDISKYDTTYLGMALLGGTYPMCVANFLEGLIVGALAPTDSKGI